MRLRVFWSKTAWPTGIQLIDTLKADIGDDWDLTYRYLSDRHLSDRHLSDRHLVNGHLVNGHLVDIHLVEIHFADT
jgi:hypothetical protein